MRAKHANVRAAGRIAAAVLTGGMMIVNAAEEKKESASTEALATFGAGCYWCVEAVFERIEGVRSVTSGFMGGAKERPTYKEVCRGNTGHAEVVQVVYDPRIVSYEQLLTWFWRIHDPTQVNRQGADVGTQYRSVIFYHSEEQRRVAEASRARLEEAKAYDRPIATRIEPAGPFWPAEDYHQDYFRRNPDAGYCRMVIAPKLEKLKLLR